MQLFFRYLSGLLFFLFSFQAIAQESWTLVPAFPGREKTCMTGAGDSILWVGTPRGIWRTGDGGFHWTQPLKSRWIHSVYSNTSGVILAGGTGMLYYSANAGVTWDSVNVPTRYPIKKILQNKSGAYFFITAFFDEDHGYTGDGVFYSSGNLRTWERRNNGLSNTSLFGEDISVDRFGRLYVAMADQWVAGDGGLFISDDDGLTWDHIQLNVAQLGLIKVQNTFSINITPHDSVIVSVAGTVTNFSTSLNIIKHRNDLRSILYWRALSIRKSPSWWLDPNLNHIHFSKNGEWYSSVTNTPALGGTYISSDNGITWLKYSKGTGTSLTTIFEAQSFFEDSYGRVFMSQFLDERIYSTTLSMIDPVTIAGKVVDDQGKPLAASIVNSFSNTYSNLNGDYQIKVPRNWSGTLTPRYSQHIFEPASVNIQAIQQDIHQNFIATYTGTHGVWGFVKDVFGNPVANVEVRGFADTILITNENGAFVSSVPHGWSGEIHLAAAAMEIYPANVMIAPVYQNVYALEFTARPEGKKMIAGKITDASGGVMSEIELQGLPEFTRIREDGTFVTLVSAGWSGSVMPLKPNHTFAPVSFVIENIQSDVTNVNFLATIVENKTYRISGMITNAAGAPLAEIRLDGFPDLVTTNAEGLYSVVVPEGWSGIVTPRSATHTFQPQHINIASITTDLKEQNFYWTLITSIEGAEGKWEVYPNPSLDGVINFRGEELNSSTRIGITTPTGQVISEETVGLLLSRGKIELPAGIYFISLSNSQTTVTKKVIVL